MSRFQAQLARLKEQVKHWEGVATGKDAEVRRSSSARLFQNRSGC
jgi:hypothetical protein